LSGTYYQQKSYGILSSCSKHDLHGIPLTAPDILPLLFPSQMDSCFFPLLSPPNFWV
jgi:hypothetical protein